MKEKRILRVGNMEKNNLLVRKVNEKIRVKTYSHIKCVMADIKVS